jgi:hypothetical protein
MLTDDAMILADVASRPQMEAVFARHRPQLVFHAAACKHLPLLEQPGQPDRRPDHRRLADPRPRLNAQAFQSSRKPASLVMTAPRNIGCSSSAGEYLLAGTSRPSASAMARTWCGPAPQQMPT